MSSIAARKPSPSRAPSSLASGHRSDRAVKGLELWGYLWSFYFCDARKSEPTYPARCHINVVPLMYVNETSDLLSGGKICIKVVVHAESTYNHQHCLSGPMRTVLLAC